MTQFGTEPVGATSSVLSIILGIVYNPVEGTGNPRTSDLKCLTILITQIFLVL